MSDSTLNDSALLRYSRHILLPDIDIAGQLKLKQSKVLIVGLGGLGSPVAMYLAASGVGYLHLLDDDVVELSNLQRQIIHRESDLSMNKAVSAAQGTQALNTEVNTQVHTERLGDCELEVLVQCCDVVIDCSDNFSTRQQVNRLCFQQKTPLVSGAAIRLEAQLSVFDFRRSDSPCYECLYRITGDEALNCTNSGILAPLVGIIGSYQALEAIKVLVGFGELLTGRVQLFNAKEAVWREFKLKKDPNCVLCGTGNTNL